MKSNQTFNLEIALGPNLGHPSYCKVNTSNLSIEVVREELEGLLNAYNDALHDPELARANIHLQLAFTIADIRGNYYHGGKR